MEKMTSIRVLSDRRADAEFARWDKAARYVTMLISGGINPADIEAEADGVELDIVEDLGVVFNSEGK